MPAVLRGGSRNQARPRAKGPSAPRGRAPQISTRGAAPGKLRAARGMGLTPGQALLAAGGVFVVALMLALATGHRSERLGLAIGDTSHKATGALGFKLAAVHVKGASPMASADILKAAGLYKGEPLMGVDLEVLRQRVARVGWVKEARVIRLLPDTLVIAVVERRQLAVWQHGGRSVVIDEHGQVIPEADPSRFPTLPLVVGAGGNEHAPEILPAVGQRPRLMARLEALVRVDDRRWDLRMKDGSLVQLPAVGEEEALIQLEQLDQRTRILELGFERIDLRDPSMMAVRLRDAALPGQLVAGGA